MDTPSARDNAEARDRHHSAIVPFKPGEITIGGSVYKGAVSQRAETFELTEYGEIKIQNCLATISKAQLVEAPAQGVMMLLGGKAFKIVEVDGFDEGNRQWHLTGQRTPGSDKV